MHNELTRKDIELMKKELDERRIVLRPKLLEAVKEARAFGDLSENYEYKAAKQEGGQNGGVGPYENVTVYLPEDDAEETYQIVTTMRQDALHGLISRESPVGRALLGAREGDTIHIQAGGGPGYDMVIRRIEKGQDSGEIPLSSF